MALAQLAEHSHDRPDRHYRRRRALAQLAAPLPEPPIMPLMSSFFFQAEDGIRAWSVTGVQTCALPIWDLVPPDLVGKADVTAQIHERLPFLDYAPICFISAIKGWGLRDLFDTVDTVAGEARKRLQPGELISIFRQAVERRPISSGGAPLRVHSVQQAPVSPPTFAAKVNWAGKPHF